MVVCEAVTVYTIGGEGAPESHGGMEGWREKRPANVLLTERERDQLFSLMLAGCSVLQPAPSSCSGERDSLKTVV